jgi:hypothetical protein
MLDNEADDQSGDDDGPHHGNHSEETLLRRLKRWERLSKSHWSKWRDEARMAYDFVAGKQWSAADKSKLIDEMRQPVTFNRVGPMVDAVTGAEILNRQEVRYLPREQGDVQTNELISAADEWSRELADTEDEESDAFSDVVICGLGWTETRMDYTDDAEGRIVDDRVDVFEMWSDPDAKKRNLADRRYQIRARWRDKEDLPAKWKKKLPTTTHGSDNLDESESGTSTRGPGDEYENDDDPPKDTEQDKRQVWIRHFQWWDMEEVFRISDPMTGTATTLDKKKMKQVVEMFLRNGLKPPQAVKIEQKKYYQAFVAGNTILEQGPVECNSFTFQAITGRRDRNANTFFGVVRAMIDPQMWGNKFFVQIMHILNTAAKGGLLYEADSFTNPRKALDDWAKPDAAIELSKGALSGPKPKVTEREPAIFPAGVEKMMEFALNNLPQTSGINLEMLGLVEREQPGVLEAQRKKAGYAILAVFFDSLRRYRKMKGRVRLYFIQHYISDGRLIRIKGKDSTQQYVPLVKDKDTATYDVIVDEAPMSPNQKEATWQMIMGLMPMLAKLNVPPEVWQVMIEYSPLPSVVSGKINEIITAKAKEPPPPDPEMLKIEAQVKGEQAKLQMQAQSEQQSAELEKEKMQFELFHDQQLFELEKMKATTELQIMREKAGIELQVAEAKGAVQQQLGAQKIDMQRESDQQKLETQKATSEQQVKAAKQKAAMKPKVKAQPA